MSDDDTVEPDAETYLGDGLYAIYVGGMIKLRAPRADGTVHVVYLDADVYDALRAFARKVGIEQ